MCSVMPSPSFQPYTLAVSKKLISCSRPRSMIRKLSSSDVTGPKFMVPKQKRLTVRPVRPRLVNSIPQTLAFAGGGRSPEENVVPAGQALARLVCLRILLDRGLAAWPQHRERGHGGNFLGRVGVVVEG